MTAFKDTFSEISPFRHQRQFTFAPFIYKEIRDFFLIGGYSCVSGSTLLTTKNGDIRIDEFNGGEILTFNDESKKLEWKVAGLPTQFPKAKLYKVILKNGYSIECTIDHKFFDINLGWVTLEYVLDHVDEIQLAISDLFHLQTNLELDQLIHHEDVNHCSQKSQDFQENYSAYSYPYGGQPLLVSSNGQAFSLQQDDAHECIQENSQKGAISLIQEYNHPYRRFFRPSIDRKVPRLFRPGRVGLNRTSIEFFEQLFETYQQSGQFPENKDPDFPILQSDLKVQCSSPSCSYSFIDSITPIGEFVYYDLAVPTNHSYVGNGFINHNCGKSFSIVLLILNIVNIYDGHEITIGLGSVTISLFRKTIWVDLERILKISGSKYSYDRQQNIIRIGTVSFQVIPIENPANIYAYNFCAFICDEIDELPQDKALMAFTAIHERTRVVFPDGRGAFACFATTAQGLKGCYQITEELRKKKKSFILIHGHTRDNTSIDKQYLADLESLYDDKEKEAFLEGKFVNLSTGRVYGDYDSKINVYPSIEIDPNETIYIGQDKNIGFCWAVALVMRDGKLYIHQNFNFDSLGSAPQEMRNAYPTNPIKWYPDASAEEIINIYIKEIRQFGIQPVMSGHNPSVQERIFCVNKMFKMNLMYIVQNGMTDDIDMALKVRQFNDLGDPAKGRGEKSPDHVVDALEYVIFRLVVSEVAFRSIYEVAKHMNQAQKLRIGRAA